MFPPVTLDGIKIYLSGKFVVLETSFGLRVRFNGDHHADVSVPKSYDGLLCGMCGKNQLLNMFLRFQMLHKYLIVHKHTTFLINHLLINDINN